MPAFSHPPDGHHTYTGPDPYAVEWQRHLADEACARGT
jgi:hypothetical protein